MADTCVPLNLDMNDCSPKRLCCGADGAVAYNKFGACPKNQGYSVDNQQCACCRPPCVSPTYRITATFTRVDWGWDICTSGNNCTIPGGSRTYEGYSVTKTLTGISNPNYNVEIKEAPLTYIGVCNCYSATGEDGYYILRFDEECSGQSMGMTQIKFKNAPNTCEGPCNEWSVEASHYHTIDSVEWYNPETGSYEDAGLVTSELGREIV